MATRRYSRSHSQTINHMGYRIEYSRLQKRWFVQDYDYELGYIDLTSKPTKLQAMIWAEQNQGIYI